MRKFAAAALALPVLALVYGPVLVRRMLAGRIGRRDRDPGDQRDRGLVGLAAPVATRHDRRSPSPRSDPPPWPARIEPHHGLREPVRLSFSAADGRRERRDGPHGRSRGRRRPAAGTPAGQTLTVAPKTGWKPATYYTVTIGRSALDATGQALAAPARAIFTTRVPIGGRLALSRVGGQGPRPGRDRDLESCSTDRSTRPRSQAAFHIDPAGRGHVRDSTRSSRRDHGHVRPDDAARAEHRLHRLARRRDPRRRRGRDVAARAARDPDHQGRVGRPLPAVRRVRPASIAAPRCRSASRPGWIAPRRRPRSARRIGTKKLKGTIQLGRGRHGPRLQAGHASCRTGPRS